MSNQKAATNAPESQGLASQENQQKTLATATKREDGNINITPYATANDFLWKSQGADGAPQLYVKKAGRSQKLQEYANKHKGIKTMQTVLVSRSNEEGKEFQTMFNALPEWMQRDIWNTRHGKVEMFTSPKGEALGHTYILFGDGTQADFECVPASKENVKMSTIHVFLDVMACTRSFNRTVGYLTANGLMNMDLIKEHDSFDYDEDDFDDEKEALRQLATDGVIPSEVVDQGREPEKGKAQGAATDAGNNGESPENYQG